jgi:hypothetical protein
LKTPGIDPAGQSIHNRSDLRDDVARTPELPLDGGQGSETPGQPGVCGVRSPGYLNA